MSDSRPRFFATCLLLLASAALLACGGGSDTTGPDPDPPLDEIPGVPLSPNSPLLIYAGTGQNAVGGEGINPRDCSLSLPQDMAVGPDGVMYIVDWNSHRIRQVDGTGLITTCIATGELGDAIDAPALEIKLNHPTHISFAPDGDLVFAAWHNSKVMRWDRQTDMVVTVAGTGARQFGGDGGPAIDAILDLPIATAWDDDGNMLIADMANQCIRQVAAAGAHDGSGTITTLYGQPREPGFTGDGGPASEANFRSPSGQSAPPAWRMFRADDGTIFVADTANHVVRRIGTDGIITTVAGYDSEQPTRPGAEYLGDGGPASLAALNAPCDVDMDSMGNLYIADTFNNCIRVVNTAGDIYTLVGIGGAFEAGTSQEGTAAGRHRLDWPFGIMIDDDDNLFIADTNNCVIRVLYNAAN